ncbi:hypothetical protein NHX12_003478 [Muraenolepis orangiensis]|uniref:Uncharacterized protein n=1 Tax=Muraenolepis orangiensis TaxID=630683 RepID=A0A9Q0E0V2_9TELE|nr:hypothetical protein NHX12_003478 [Muraenolepis orangiensis]
MGTSVTSWYSGSIIRFYQGLNVDLSVIVLISSPVDQGEPGVWCLLGFVWFDLGAQYHSQAQRPFLEETRRPFLEETRRPFLEETRRPFLEETRRPFLEETRGPRANRGSRRPPPAPWRKLLQRPLVSRRRRSDPVNPSDPLRSESHPGNPAKEPQELDPEVSDQDQAGAVSKETITSCDDPLKVLHSSRPVSPIKTNIAERACQD